MCQNAKVRTGPGQTEHDLASIKTEQSEELGNVRQPQTTNTENKNTVQAQIGNETQEQ